MSAPNNESKSNASSRTSRPSQGLYGLVLTVLREVGWLAKQTGVYFALGARLAASFARQRGLQARRSRILQEIGEELRRGPIPESLQGTLRECDNYDEEIKGERAALVSQPRAGWFSRASRKIRLLKAQWARGSALRRLGAAGLAIVSPESLGPYQATEASIAGEQTRRSQFREPWRALSPPRRMAVHASAILVLAALLLIGLRWFQTPTGELPQITGDVHSFKPETGIVDESKTSAPAMQTDRENTRNLPQDFAQQRAAAVPGTWLIYAGNPVIQRGSLEEWDNFKVGAPAVLKEGNRYRMWYRGCYFIELEYKCGVGHATSTDGAAWQKSAQPVFVPDNVHESERMNSLAVVRAGDRYMLWYSVNPNYFIGRPYATIHLATSADGLNWQSGGLILRSFSQYTPAIEPSVVYDGKLFHLWYADYYPSDSEKVMLHLTSQDGKGWQIAGSTSLNQLKAGPGRLSVLADGRGGYRAFFAYERTAQSEAGVFGMLLSADGNQWQHAEAGVKLASRDIGNNNGHAVAPAALVAPDGLEIWFALRPDDGAEEIRMAFLKAGAP